MWFFKEHIFLCFTRNYIVRALDDWSSMKTNLLLLLASNIILNPITTNSQYSHASSSGCQFIVSLLITHLFSIASP